MTNQVEIVVCMGSSCFARGNEQNLAIIEAFVKANKINANIELAGSRCEGKCADGPNLIVDGIAYDKVDENKLTEILNNLNNLH